MFIAAQIDVSLRGIELCGCPTFVLLGPFRLYDYLFAVVKIAKYNTSKLICKLTLSTYGP